MPTVTPTSISSVFNRARFFLNDNNAELYSDSALIEPVNQAIADLREVLQDNGISVVESVSEAITVTAGVTNIGGNGGPALPNDLLVPVSLWERTADTEVDYLLMAKKHPLPKTNVRTAFLMYWDYRNQIIEFIGATGNIQVKIDYIASRMLNADSGDSQIDVKEAHSFLSMQTAGYAAGFIGENETRAADLFNMASKALEMVVNLDIRQSQNQPVRKRPFMASWKRRSGIR